MENPVEEPQKVLKLPTTKSGNGEFQETIKSSDFWRVYDEYSNTYLNFFRFYSVYFKQVPHFIGEKNIDSWEANTWFVEHYDEFIQDYYFTRMYGIGEKSPYDIYYILKNDILVNIDMRLSKVRILFKNTALSEMEELATKFRKFKRVKDKKSLIYIIQQTEAGLSTSPFEIKPTAFHLEENYNEDLLPIHEIIIKRLNQKNDKGLLILHGKPGTGKTHYIRHLISMVSKQVIFLPPNMAQSLTLPSMMPFLLENPNTILVIEDAELVVQSRDQNGGSAVSALLNLTDGILADCLNIQIICTFNTDISMIDKALLRKGRLIAQYEFKELELEKGKKLAQSLGFEKSIEKPMSLSEIYNLDEMDFEFTPSKGKIGFTNGR
jgi:hypothetical protein